MCTLGTNTDSVIVDITRTNDPTTRGVIATFKHETTVDITTGIELAVKKVLEQAGISHGSDSDQILSLTVGTTVEHMIYSFLHSIDLSILAFHQCDCTARCN
jgi:N-methylhydantoinase A/oxoprolinase/acetone carboxylase beta subunit